VHADQTTLGADNGIAVAMIMAIFADRSLKHGPLEALITSDEEMGMEGIQKFDISRIHAQYMLNLDNEDDSEICIGCPGNVDIEGELFFKRDAKKSNSTTNLKITVSGGIGGHSGQTIGQKRVNAIKEIFDVLTFIKDAMPLQLVHIEKAGVAKNNIPYECTAEICVDTKNVNSVKQIVNQEFTTLLQEYAPLEKDIKITCEVSKTKLLPINEKDSNLIISVLASVPNAVHTFNWKYNVPETSSNLGLIEMRNKSV
jgi:dipeptidase D